MGDRFTVVDRELSTLLRAHSLLLHLGFITGEIKRHLPLSSDIIGQIQWEAIGVVEFKYQFAGNNRATHMLESLIKNLHTMIEGLSELLLFFVQHLCYLSCLYPQFWVCLSHFVSQRIDQLIEKRTRCTQLIAMPYRTPNDSAEHITPAFIAWTHIIDNQKSTGSDMISNDLERIVR